MSEKEDIKNAVNNFARAMKKKLFLKEEEGFRGWDDPAFRPIIAKKLYKHVERQKNGEGQEVDIANLAMMLWFTKDSQ